MRICWLFCVRLCATRVMELREMFNNQEPTSDFPKALCTTLCSIRHHFVVNSRDTDSCVHNMAGSWKRITSFYGRSQECNVTSWTDDNTPYCSMAMRAGRWLRIWKSEPKPLKSSATGRSMAHNTENTRRMNVWQQINVLVRRQEFLLSTIKRRKLSWFGHVYTDTKCCR